MPVDWYNNVLRCRKLNTPCCQMTSIDRAVYQSLGISDAKLLLSPSCKQCLSQWQRISVVAIEKQSAHVIGFANISSDLVNHIDSILYF